MRMIIMCTEYFDGGISVLVLECSLMCHLGSGNGFVPANRVRVNHRETWASLIPGATFKVFLSY